MDGVNRDSGRGDGEKLKVDSQWRQQNESRNQCHGLQHFAPILKYSHSRSISGKLGGHTRTWL